MLGPPVGRGDVESELRKGVTQVTESGSHFEDFHAAPRLEVDMREEIRQSCELGLAVVAGLERGFS
jgi:hypothetical protein